MPHLVVKRKQPPPFHTIYPAPDPADPFAPLSVLRSRASTSLLDTYPLPYTDSTSDEGSTDAEPMVILAVERPEGTTAKMARYLSPRNVRSRSVSQARTPPGKRLHKLSISPPMNFKHLSSADPTIPQHSFFTKEPDDSFLGSCTLADPCQPTQAHSSPSSHARNSVDTIRSVSNALPTSSTSPFSSDSSLTSPQSMPIHLITPSPVPHPTLTSSTTVPIVTPRRRDSYHYHNRRLSRLSPSDVEWAIPTRSQLAQASLLPVITESGLHVSFGSLFQEQRTIVIFIRHFWCPFCQDYMTSLTSLAHPDMMFSGPTAAETKSCSEQDRVQLVVISNGAHTLISKYKRLFALPFSVYTDPSLALYTALGMGVAGQRNPATPPIHAALHEKAGSKEKAKIVDGGYARHGVITGLAMVIGRAIKVGMPVWGNCGDVRQLGGEFILGPGLKCTYAHRMQVAKGHAPVRDVLQAAGVHTPFAMHMPLPAVMAEENRVEKAEKGRRRSMGEFGTALASRRQTIDVLMEHSLPTDEEWMAERARSLERLKQKKNMRRTYGGHYHYSQTAENKEQLAIGETTLG